jgi:hypothetical protein
MVIALLFKIWFNVYSYEQVDVSIALEIPKCITLEVNNEITFVVSNSSGEQINIYTSYLSISKVLTQEGNKIIPLKRIRHQIPDNIPECVSIPAFSSKTITVNVNYFSAYDIAKGQVAQVIGMYQTTYLNKKQKKGLETLYTSPAVFKVCDK